MGVEREMRRIQAHFGRTSMPEPQLEAPLVLLDRPLFPSLSHATTVTDAPPSARLPWVEVKRADADGFLLTQGVTLGARPSSTWTVFPPNETAFAPGQSLGLLTVTQLRGKDALAKPQGAPFSIPPGARAVAFCGPLRRNGFRSGCWISPRSNAPRLKRSYDSMAATRRS